jgi:SAM-dependent methyltransferase
MVFEKYAQYYDLLYQDKNYDLECSYVTSLINKFRPDTKKILEFGSGTGIHGRKLGKAGYEVRGIERSQKMIMLGEKRSTTNHIKENSNFSCILGDCKSAFIADDFDTVISLFHVLSYQTSVEDARAMLRNAHRQLTPRGIFFFDYWYAPAVWNIGPTLRVKRVNNNELSITRIADPECYKQENIVKVNYQTFVEDLKTKNISKIEEQHDMRAFDIGDIIELANFSGFRIVHSEEWITGASPSVKTWGVCTILEKE